MLNLEDDKRENKTRHCQCDLPLEQEAQQPLAAGASSARAAKRATSAGPAARLVYLALACLIGAGPWGGSRLARADSDANRLYEDLMMTYNRIVRPVQNESDRVVVRVSLKLSQLMEVVSRFCARPKALRRSRPAGRPVGGTGRGGRQ